MLGRAREAQRLVDSLAASLDVAQARLLFMVNTTDRRTRAACEATGADVRAIEGGRRPGDYQRKINTAVGLTREEWIFTGASDLVFRPGWLDEALRIHEGRKPGVVGTNDMANLLVRRGRMSTHSLVHRAYVQQAVIDAPGHLYSEAYDHNYCDMELVSYARFQHRWWFARNAIVEHRHPSWKTAPMDRTYEISLRNFMDDQRLYFRRMQMWRPPSLAQRRRDEARERTRRRLGR